MASNDFEREIEKIFINKWSNGRNLSTEQLKTLRKYKEYYENKKSSKGGIIKTSSVWNSMFTLRELGLYLKKPYEKATKKDMLDFFIRHLKGKSEATLSNWKVLVRSFYKWMHGIKKKHEFPKIVDDERLEPVRAKPRKVSPSDLYTKDEIIKMLSVCRTPMDKAIVSIWNEMGIRAKEYVTANVGSVEFLSGGCKFFVEESKTEEGFVPLIESAPYLQEWLQIHPYKDNPKAPLFIGLSKYYGDRLRPNAINQKLKRIALRAGIKKRIFTHLGRNMSITRMDGTMSVEDNARLHGITPDTVFRVYTKRSRKEACKKYFDLYGREKTEKEIAQEQEEEDKLKPKVCVSCDEINPYDCHYCKKCLRPVDLGTFAKLDTIQQKQLEEMKESIKQEILRDFAKKEVMKELLAELRS